VGVAQGGCVYSDGASDWTVSECMGKRRGASCRGGGGSGSAAPGDSALYEALLSGDEEAAEAVDVTAYERGVECADVGLQIQGGEPLSPAGSVEWSPEAPTPHIVISVMDSEPNEPEDTLHASLARSLPELSPQLLCSPLAGKRAR
jgi:hypothetical protein